MRKRFLSTLLALCMALTLLPGTAGAAEQRVIHVSTVDELKAELKSNTKIIMDDGNYNVGNGLYIQDIDNLTIQGGKKTRIVGSEYEIELDTVIMSLGTSPNPLIASTTKGLETNRRKCIVAEEENGQTSKAAVFAGGDAVTGAATVILAMGAGKAGAKGIHELLSAK